MVPPSPKQLCECGCGEPAPLAEVTRRREGWVKGQPRRFIHGHQRVANGRKNRGGGRPPKSARAYEVRDCGHATACWVWLRGTTMAGYGCIWLGDEKRLALAHRVMYERHVGPIPEGAHLHHECGVKGCVNPGHLRTLTRSAHAAAHRLDACNKGHPFSEENTYVAPDGRRQCRECRREADRRRRPPGTPR